MCGDNRHIHHASWWPVPWCFALQNTCLATGRIAQVYVSQHRKYWSSKRFLPPAFYHRPLTTPISSVATLLQIQSLTKHDEGQKKHVSATTWAEYVYRIQPLIIWSWRQMTRSTKIYSNFTIHNQIHIQWQFTDWEIEKIRNRDVCPAVRHAASYPNEVASLRSGPLTVRAICQEASEPPWTWRKLHWRALDRKALL
jgi:hypothetical protein